WVPIIYECENEQHSLLTSTRSATMFLQKSSPAGARKKPTVDLDLRIGAPCDNEDCNSDILI
ncbi:hypothetical protein V8B55DRAFT_1338763, partial [Mucor lusitanicus]